MTNEHCRLRTIGLPLSRAELTISHDRHLLHADAAHWKARYQTYVQDYRPSNSLHAAMPCFLWMSITF